jgi:hypothetical protein
MIGQALALDTLDRDLGAVDIGEAQADAAAVVPHVFPNPARYESSRLVMDVQSRLVKSVFGK